MSATINDLLRDAAQNDAAAPALLAPRARALSYGQLWEHVQQIAGALGTTGIGPSDRVAVVLQDGPEMAASFLAVSSAAICAPLNPKYKTSEFEFYLSDLNPKALILETGVDSPAAAVARSRGIRVIELVPQADAEAGVFRLEGIPLTEKPVPVVRHGDEVSLILHTSGTTSRPKMVPLTQANLCSSARNIAVSLRLKAQDRCLNVMPLFHIHGLVGALLSTIVSRSSVVCTSGFDSSQFFDWFEEFQPSWYTAVPTMHQAILGRAAHVPGIHSRSRLRFIRSCSSALPPKLMAQLEGEFGVPVVEAYGMTEASHQMAINPLPPESRKPGSVGLAAGCEIAILDDDWIPLPAGEIGAVAVRGPSVTQGYDNSPEANESSFRGGWFRTGDQGKLDSEGYLFLTGRTKEIINRAGEKISPREIDEVLLDHPGVAQAMAFAVPDQRLGEDVAAAVVLREPIPWSGSSEIETELRGFVAQRLASFKAPRQIVFLKEIPKGPTGKPQRIGIAAKLGLTGSAEAAATDCYVPAQSELEMQIIKIWEELLDARPIGIRQDFFKIGGDSVLAVRMLAELESVCGVLLSESCFFPAATVENVASAMLRAQKNEPRSPIVEIQPSGSQPPLFFLHGQWRGGGLYCGTLSRLLGRDQPFFAIVPHGLDGGQTPRSIPAMAADRVRTLLEAHPTGPLRLGGYCNGALVAFEMARQLEKLGRKVDLLVLVETHAPNTPFRKTWNLVWLASALLSLKHDAQAACFLRLRTLQIAWREASQNGARAAAAFLLQKARNMAARVGRLAKPTRSGMSSASANYADDSNADPFDAIDAYVPRPYRGRVVLIRTQVLGSRTANFSAHDDPSAGWAEVVPQVQVRWIPGTHETIVRDQLNGMAQELAQCLAKIDSFPAGSSVSRDSASHMHQRRYRLTHS